MIEQSAGLWWPSPAKLNLFLHITGRRADGYHQLQTVFQLLDFGDRLQFILDHSAEATLANSLSGVADRQNLVIKAAEALLPHAPAGAGVRIRLDKRVPMGAGLAGGSSNAATTLLVLNQLWGLGLSVDQLAQLGLKLGADVPVFIRGYSAWAEGVGEKITPIELPEYYFAVVYPGVAISTADIFSEKSLTRDCKVIRMRDLNLLETENVCESVAKQKFPPVAQALAFLQKSQPVFTRMTGTGSSCFAAFNSEQSAKKALQNLPENWQGFFAKGLPTSPICDIINKIEA